MAVREVIGKTDCPECGSQCAELRRQAKSGLAYRYCGDCGAQYFARTPEADARLMRRAIGATKPAEPKPAEPAPAEPGGLKSAPPQGAAGPVVSRKPASEPRGLFGRGAA